MEWTRGQMRDINHFCHRHFKLNPRLLIVTTSKPALPTELPISEVQFLFSVAPAEDLGVTVESFVFHLPGPINQQILSSLFSKYTLNPNPSLLLQATITSCLDCPNSLLSCHTASTLSPVSTGQPRGPSKCRSE